MKKNSWSYLFVMFLIVALVANEKQVELVIKYPEKLVKGTEIPKTVGNLEASRPENETPKLLMVPEGYKKLSKEKAVLSSDNDPNAGDLDMVTDDDADGNEYVQLKKGLQWVQIDLEEAYTLYGAHVWHYHSQPRVYFDIIVQVSNDPDFIQGVTTVFNNDDDNSSGLGKGTDKNYIEEYYGKTIDLKGTKGRYVRFYSNGNSADSSNHYIEIQVFGK